MTESYGEYRPREGVILLQKVLCGQETVNTTFHEIMHACVYAQIRTTMYVCEHMSRCADFPALPYIYV